MRRLWLLDLVAGRVVGRDRDAILVTHRTCRHPERRPGVWIEIGIVRVVGILGFVAAGVCEIVLGVRTVRSPSRQDGGGRCVADPNRSAEIFRQVLGVEAKFLEIGLEEINLIGKDLGQRAERGEADGGLARSLGILSRSDA